MTTPSHLFNTLSLFSLEICFKESSYTESSLFVILPLTAWYLEFAVLVKFYSDKWIIRQNYSGEYFELNGKGMRRSPVLETMDSVIKAL